MNSVNTSGLSIGQYKNIHPEFTRKFSNFYNEFAETTHDIKILSANLTKELAKLTKKLETSPSDKLKMIVEEKTRTLEQINKFIQDGRDAYFSNGKAIGDRADIWLDIALQMS
jgi:hypothetical protein